MNPASATIAADAPKHPLSSASRSDHAPRSPHAWPVAILGVPFDPVTIEDSVARIDAMIAPQSPHYVMTANVDFLVQAHRVVALRRILLEADLVLCDGTPVLWASRWLGNALPECVSGLRHPLRAAGAGSCPPVRLGPHGVCTLETDASAMRGIHAPIPTPPLAKAAL